MKSLSLAAGIVTAGLLFATGAQATTLYDNGPADHANVAWTIDLGFSVADSFTLSSASTVTGVDYTGWNDPGATTSAVDWSILSAEPNGPFSVLASGTASLTGTFLLTSALDFDVYNEAFSVAPLALSAGTYWLQLNNAVSSDDFGTFWEINGGPSQAWESQDGDVTTGCDEYPTGRCSSTFDILGTNGSVTAVPEPFTLSLFGAGLAGLVVMRRRKAIKA